MTSNCAIVEELRDAVKSFMPKIITTVQVKFATQERKSHFKLTNHPVPEVSHYSAYFCYIMLDRSLKMASVGFHTCMNHMNLDKAASCRKSTTLC